MNKPYLLIADSSPDFCSRLHSELKDAFVIQCCTNGKEAMEYLRSRRPDVIVLDLMLPQLDGISLLCKAAACGIQPAVLATTRLVTEYILETAQKLSVDYLIKKPCDISAAAERVRDLRSRIQQISAPAPDPAEVICRCLTELGFSNKLRGYAYLRDALLLWSKEPGVTFTKVLYPEVGSLHGTNGILVERCMRSAINTAWENRREDIWAQYFQTDANGRVPHPSNSTFITELSGVLRLEQNKEQKNA